MTGAGIRRGSVLAYHSVPLSYITYDRGTEWYANMDQGCGETGPTMRSDSVGKEPLAPVAAPTGKRSQRALRHAPGQTPAEIQLTSARVQLTPVGDPMLLLKG